jgi:hypothetical protein
LTGLRHGVALAAALVVALVAIGGWAFPAAAHGVHPHGGPGFTVTGAGLHRQPAATQVPRSHDMAADATSLDQGSRHETPDRSHGSECCCGSALCHAGVVFVSTAVVTPPAHGERVRPEPSAGEEGRAPSGLERPPRDVLTA